MEACRGQIRKGCADHSPLASAVSVLFDRDSAEDPILRLELQFALAWVFPCWSVLCMVCAEDWSLLVASRDTVTLPKRVDLLFHTNHKSLDFI